MSNKIKIFKPAEIILGTSIFFPFFSLKRNKSEYGVRNTPIEFHHNGEKNEILRCRCSYPPNYRSVLVRSLINTNTEF